MTLCAYSYGANDPDVIDYLGVLITTTHMLVKKVVISFKLSDGYN